MRIFGRLLPLLVSLVLLTPPAQAGALRVLPVGIDLTLPSSAGTITLRNEARTPAAVQIRIFRWSQNGSREDQLTPTTDVAVSPPQITLRPGADYVVRVVRTAKTMPEREETYRLLVDELPTPGTSTTSNVTFLVRQSIPVFFAPPGATGPQVTWSARVSGRTLVIKADNAGGKRQQLTDLVVRDDGGAVLRQFSGLAGYVLAGSSKTWEFPLPAAARSGRALRVSATTDGGRIDERVLIASGQ
ncbi:molecular chaperone [Xanthobacteraceae bacterium A53D]